MYIFVANYILTQLFNNPHVPGLLQVVAILYGALVTIPVILGVRLGLRIAIALYVFEVVVLAIFVLAVLGQGGVHGLSGTPFTPGTGGLKTLALGFALAFFAYGGFEAPAPLAEETENPPRARRAPMVEQRPYNQLCGRGRPCNQSRCEKTIA